MKYATSLQSYISVSKSGELQATIRRRGRETYKKMNAVRLKVLMDRNKRCVKFAVLSHIECKRNQAPLMFVVSLV
jgi:hypothetical protein